MGAIRHQIDGAASEFIAAQRVFFVATAPLKGDGLVNLSPKGLDTFRVLGARRAAYLDYTGSGVETIAHLRENGRLTIMFCAFQGPPNILRLYGRGCAVELGDAACAGLLAEFGTTPSEAERAGVRAVIVLEVTRVADSCGFGVPRYDYAGERGQLAAWAEKKGVEGLREYRKLKNARSLDGLEGLAE